MRDTKLSSWMEFFVHVSQSLVVDMGVNLRGSNVDVAEHLLNAAQVGTAS